MQPFQTQKPKSRDSHTQPSVLELSDLSRVSGGSSTSTWMSTMSPNDGILDPTGFGGALSIRSGPLTPFGFMENFLGS